MTKRKILWGVCGIGNGHLYRQLPLVEEFAREHTIVIVSSEKTLQFLQKRFSDIENVHVVEALVPFYAGTNTGIDWQSVGTHPLNLGKDFEGSRERAFAEIVKTIGTPDLVISDYEPTAAAYSYHTGGKLVTIDQQSKFLARQFPAELGGYTYADEVERLRFFFPTATERIVASFFAFDKKSGEFPVTQTAPIVRPSLLPPTEGSKNSAECVVYLSAARRFPQSLQEVISVLGNANATFHVFTDQHEIVPTNVTLHELGDPDFEMYLRNATGVIATAGHTLLSESMYLTKPVYAIPVSPYEQFLNASVISGNGFGLSHERLEPAMLGRFLENAGLYSDNIRSDKTVLLKGSGFETVQNLLRRSLEL